MPDEDPSSRNLHVKSFIQRWQANIHFPIPPMKAADAHISSNFIDFLLVADSEPYKSI
jgi:hypothetical protein